MANGTRFLRLASIVVGLALAGFSAYELFYLSTWQPLKRLAIRLEGGEAISVAHAMQFEDRYPTTVFRGRCKLAERRSVLTFHLKALDAVHRERRGIADIDAATDSALAAATALVACDPVEGNGWLRLAMVESQLLGSAPSVIEKVDFSYWTAPNEDWVMRERIRFLSRLVSAGLDAVSPALEREVIRFGEYAPTREVTDLYRFTGPRARQVFAEALTQMSSDRREALQAAISR